MEVKTNKVGDIDVVSFTGRLDAYTSNDAEKEINNILDGGSLKLLVNFEAVDYISSSGLRVMLASLKRLKKINGQIKLACLKSSIKEVFEISGFNQLFEFYKTEEEALGGF
jgi:anti-sigma B factor antagonist